MCWKTPAVVLAVRTEGGYRTLGGRDLGVNGERVSDTDIAREVLADSIRLRAGLADGIECLFSGASPSFTFTRVLALGVNCLADLD